MTDRKTIVCRLTPAVPSAIATIAVRGPAAVDAVLAIANLKVVELRINRVHYGTVQLAASAASEANEQVVVCRTSDNEVELHCHGGQAVCRALLRALSAQGCELIDAADWPTAHQGSIAAAAEHDLLQATTDKAAAVLLDQLNGALDRRLEAIQELIHRQELSTALADLKELRAWSDLGLHLINPWRVVFAGPPNVGKSSLMNAMVGQTKSIVHDQPGTTRDWIDTEIVLNGWPVSLTDTAGIRISDDHLEGEGVQRARERAAAADLLVLVVDSHMGWTPTHADLLELTVPRYLVAWNKADLGYSIPTKLETQMSVVATSAIAAPGIDALMRQVATALIPREPAVAQAIPFRSSQVLGIQSAQQFLCNQQPEAAIQELQRLMTSWIAE